MLTPAAPVTADTGEEAEFTVVLVETENTSISSTQK